MVAAEITPNHIACGCPALATILERLLLRLHRQHLIVQSRILLSLRLGMFGAPKQPQRVAALLINSE
jgi:hypothetical protein